MQRKITTTATRLHPSDAPAVAALALSATRGVVQIVEDLHRTILGSPALAGIAEPVTAVTGVVYRSIHAVTGGLQRGLDLLARRIPKLDPQRAETPERRRALAVLNGVWGDELEAANSPLAIRMTLYGGDQPLEPEALARHTRGRPVLLFVHGSCMADTQWFAAEADDGERAVEDAPPRVSYPTQLEAAGWCPVFLRYNSGLSIASNGARLAALLDRCGAGSVQAVIAHSMGGLLMRSALEQAVLSGMDWPRQLQHLVMLGTPHGGAPLERLGARLDQALRAHPWLAPFARIGGSRSVGIRDLHSARIHAEPLDCAPEWPAGLRLQLLAGCQTAGRPGALARAWGDGLVPVDSALATGRSAQHAELWPVVERELLPALGHLDLLHSPAVLARIAPGLRLPD